MKPHDIPYGSMATVSEGTANPPGHHTPVTLPRKVRLDP